MFATNNFIFYIDEINGSTAINRVLNVALKVNELKNQMGFLIQKISPTVLRSGKKI